jgi:hypothetical protein
LWHVTQYVSIVALYGVIAGVAGGCCPAGEDDEDDAVEIKANTIAAADRT